jgi:hypothetical protein
MTFLEARWKPAASQVTDEGRDDKGCEESIDASTDPFLAL